VIHAEFQKQLFRLRTYIALGLMAGIPTLLTLAFKFGGHPGNDRERSFFSVATSSGLNVPLAALSAMSVFLIPIVVLIFAGSSVAEEANWGSLRYLLIRPVSRSRLLASKLTVAATLGVAAILIVVTVGTLEGIVAFGWHPVTSPTFGIFQPGDALGRIALATLYVIWSMSGIVAFGFLLSTMTTSSMGAVSGAMGVAIVSQILEAIQPLKNLRSFLPTHYWHAWESLFANPTNTDHLIRGVLLQAPYVIVLLGLAWWWFQRKDIMT
jgi:ABC-2 type transport system permease protein